MKLHRILLDPAIDGGGGSVAVSAAPTTPSTEPQGAPEPSTAKALWGGTVEPTPSPSAEPAPVIAPPGGAVIPPAPAAQSPAQPSFTPEQMAQVAASAATAAVRAGQPVPSQPELSADELRRQFNVFTPTQEHLTNLFSPDPKVALQTLDQMLQGIATQAVTIASAQMEYAMSQQSQRFAPALHMATSAQERALEGEFMELNPDLKGYEPLLLQLKNSLVQRGVKGLSKEQAFKIVADEARGMIKVLPAGGGNGQSVPGGGSARTQQPTLPKMPSLSGGGQGGAGGTGPTSGTGRKSTAESIFG